MKGSTNEKSKIWINQVSEKIYQRMMEYRSNHQGNTDRIRKRSEELQCLDPANRKEIIEKAYMIQKINLILLIVVAGIFIILCSLLSVWSSGVLVNGREIERKSYGGGDLNTTLMAKVVDESVRKENIEVLVHERRYTDEEIESLYEQFLQELERVLPGENTALGDVRLDMKLPTYLAEYPFRIMWETSDYTLLNPDGTLGERTANVNGEQVRLVGAVSYFDWKKELQKEVTVYPPMESKEGEWKEVLEEQVEKENLNTATISHLQLPTSINGKEIQWEEIQENHTPGLCLLLVAVLIAISVGMDQDIHKKVEERNKEMARDYPEIISKLSLFIGAGMSIRRAWQRIATDYQKNKEQKRYAYEEMLITCHEMESGIAESKSYDNFAKRCQVQSYLKLGTLLSQNLKKGSANLQKVLQEESKTAFEEQKVMARKLGEEAGTKLLLPMTLMFGIVMIVVIVPAFLSFSV